MGCGSPKLNDLEHKQLAKQFQHNAKVGEILNNIRKKPYQYTKLIEKQLKNFKKSKTIEIKMGCNQIQYQTIQGPAAWNYAIKFLKTQYLSGHQLIKNNVLCRAAAQRAQHYFNRQLKQHKQLLKSQQTVPTSLNRAPSTHDIAQQIKQITGTKIKPGDYAVLVGMDFKLKQRNHIQNALLGLIIDDGNSGRTSRNLLFSQNFKYYGSFITLTNDYVIVVVCLSSQNLLSVL